MLASGATAALATRHVDAVSRHMTMESLPYQDQVGLPRPGRVDQEVKARKEGECVTTGRLYFDQEGLTTDINRSDNSTVACRVD